MTLAEAYDKYEHLDDLLCDRDWLPDTFLGKIVYDLWQAIKQEKEATAKKEVTDDRGKT